MSRNDWLARAEKVRSPPDLHMRRGRLAPGRRSLVGLTAVFAMSRSLLALPEIYDGGSRGDAARNRQTNLTEINVGDQGAYGA